MPQTSEANPTVAQVLLPSDQAARLPESQPGALEQLRRGLAQEVKSADWGAVRDVLLHKLAEALDQPLLEPLAAAWSKLDEIRGYADRDRYPPDVTALVPLLDHDIDYTQQPRVQLKLGDQLLGTLQFDVSLRLALKGIQLEIRNARIMRVLAGSWQGVGNLGLEGKSFYEHKLPEVRLDGAVSLGAGFDIAGDGAAAPSRRSGVSTPG